MLEKKIRRYKLMDAHRELVRTGKLYEAYLVLEFLRKGKLKLYLGEADWNVEKLCEDLGCKFGYNSRGIHSNGLYLNCRDLWYNEKKKDREVFV